MKLDLDDSTITYLARSAKTAQKVEAVFIAKVKAQIAARVENIIYALENNSAMPAVDFAALYTQLMLEALEKGYSTETQIRLASDRGFAPARGKKKTLFDFWKERVDRGYRPKRLEVLARKTQKRFDAAMEKLHEMWKNPEVRHDKEYSRVLVKSALVSTESYAAMVVATETTRYYNKARRDFYDAVPQVTHYMFVSIRDNRTTPWCKTRQHLIYEKGSAYLERETPPCFLGKTPILTSKGWLPIEEIKEGDYVYTAKGNWRKVTSLHCTSKGLVEIFQIGGALATANHPYLRRSGEYIFAKEFRPEEGLCAVFIDVSIMWGAKMAELEPIQRPFVMQPEVSPRDFSEEKLRERVGEMERWCKNIKAWIPWDTRQSSSKSGFSRICSTAQMGYRKGFRTIFGTRGSCTPYRSEQKKQLHRESSADVYFRSHATASKIGWINTAEEHANVYNLEVEDDHSYNAGGFFVHNCHPNCRSEILPLMPLNPKHKKLIDDESMWRQNNSPVPLIKGWNE